MFSRKSERIPPFHVMEVLERAQELERAGKSIIHLEIGEPDRFGGKHVKEMVATYDRRRKYIRKRLVELGFGIKSEPEGAYYVLANAKKFGPDSLLLSRRILEEAGVAVTPGIDFGDGAEGYLRFSYASSLENIREGLDRIEKYLNN